MQVLLVDAQEKSQRIVPSPEQALQLVLLAEVCAGCVDTGDAPPKAADTADATVTQNNAEAVEGLCAALRSAEQLQELLLGLVKACVHQLHQADAPATTGQLPEALPGEASGCGELLKSCRHQHMLAW